MIRGLPPFSPRWIYQECEIVRLNFLQIAWFLQKDLTSLDWRLKIEDSMATLFKNLQSMASPYVLGPTVFPFSLLIEVEMLDSPSSALCAKWLKAKTILLQIFCAKHCWKSKHHQGHCYLCSGKQVDGAWSWTRRFTAMPQKCKHGSLFV